MVSTNTQEPPTNLPSALLLTPYVKLHIER